MAIVVVVSVSVVIPAFNEQSTIRACLERVIAQGGAVDEVVVVDNNSTDGTAAIVAEIAREHPTVRMIHEPQPGLSHARYAGFDAARSSVIAGIDADTHVGPGWADAIAAMFESFPAVGAGTGPAAFYDMPFQDRFRRRADAMNKRARDAAARGQVCSMPQVSGANTALRQSTWRQVRDQISYRRDVYEDLDLSLTVLANEWQVVLVPGMTAEVSGRRLLSGPRDFLRYGMCIPRTYRLHGNMPMSALTTAIVLLQTVSNTLKLPLSRAWDPTQNRFRLRRLRASRSEIRVPPVSSGLD